MKYVRFMAEGRIGYGILEGEEIQLLGGPFLQARNELTGVKVRLGDVALLAPVEPGKIVCVGLNYFKHAKEMNHAIPEEPVIFLKPPSAVLAPEGEIIFPTMSERVDYEAELAVVIGQTLKDASEEEAVAGIFGYTCANDVTARDLQQKDGQWVRAKSFDTFCPLGPWVVTGIEPDNLDIKLYLNGEIRQSSNTKDFMNPVPRLVSYISHIMTLNPGDVILTGTPEGIGPMQSEDEVVVAIELIGELKNYGRRP